MAFDGQASYEAGYRVGQPSRSMGFLQVPGTVQRRNQRFRGLTGHLFTTNSCGDVANQF